MPDFSTPDARPVQVERWPSELPLRAVLWVCALGLWALIVLSIIGLIYGLVIAAVLFVAHVAFIAHLRGSAVRLGPEQMPELYYRVQQLAGRIGMQKAPDAYLMQAGGALNALATKFLGSNFIVLYSELLDACGDNTDARDFIIAHELGHLHAGHLRYHWVLAPAAFIPFLGTAYSRACEYTCDRYGYAASDNQDKALDGLCILAAGGKHGPRLNRLALISQRADVNTVWMKLGQWLSTHPPIAHRVAALSKNLVLAPVDGVGSTVGAIALLASLVIVPSVGVAAFLGTQVWAEVQQAMEKQRQSTAQQAGGAATGQAASFADLDAEADAGISTLVETVQKAIASNGAPPADLDELYSLWSQQHPGQSEPLDPYDGARFGYLTEEGEFYIWSAGPNPETQDDDISFASDGW